MRVTKTREPELLNRYQIAPMAESVDAGDSKSLAQKAWGFESLSGHQSFEPRVLSSVGRAVDF